ncbi:MAG: MFS transporter [Chloroflexota bacterium]
MPYAVIACSLMMCWAMGVRSSFFTVMPKLATEVGLSTGAAAALIGAQSVGYCLGMWGIGFVPGTRKRRVLVGAVVSLVFIVAVTLAPNAALLYPLAFLSGLGAGFYLPLGLSILADASQPHQRARNQGLHELFATFGHMGGPAFVGATALLLTWQQETLAFSLVGVVACLGFAFLREPWAAAWTRVGPPPPLVVDAKLVACVVAFGSSQILTAGIVAVMPLVLVTAWQLPLSEAAGVVSLGRVASVVGVMLSALVGDRWGPARVARLYYGLGLLCMVGLAVLPFGPAFVALYWTANLAGSGGIVLLSVILAHLYSGRTKERALSVITGVAGLWGLAGVTVLFGFMLERGWTALIFLGTALACLVVFALVGHLSRRRVPDAQPVSGETTPS